MAMYLGDKPVKAIARSKNNLLDAPSVLEFKGTGSMYYFNVDLTGTYTLSFRARVTSYDFANAGFVRITVDGAYKYITYVTSPDRIYSMKVTGHITAIDFVNYSHTVGVITEIMLNEGSTALPYEPYNQLFTVPIKKIVRTTNTVMFNGTEDWFVDNAPSFPIGHYGVNGNFKADVKTNKYGVDVICNHYSFSADGRNIHKSMRFAYGVGNRMFFSDKDYPTLDEWKAHLAELANSGNPVTVTYRLSTPVIDGYEY